MTVEIYAEKYTLGGTELNIELTADHRGLTACRLLPQARIKSLQTNNSFLVEAATALEGYVQNNNPELITRIAPDGTPFQQRVWQITREIPYGEVRSYSWIASELGSPKAVRAVAQALAANPLLLFVPCHRVVRNNGDLGGFACGTDWKKRLLAHEGIIDTRNVKLVAVANSSASSIFPRGA